MLVLNTNQNGELKSNVRWAGFPDFSQIIIKPAYAAGVWKGQIASMPAIRTIQGTPINLRTDAVYEDRMASLPNNQYQGRSFSFQNSNSNSDLQSDSCRIGVPKSLSGGEIIGREVYFECYCQMRGEIKIKITPKVIHSDGTISEAGDAPWLTMYNSLNQHNFTLNGVEARAGDIVVVDIECNLKNSSYSSSSNRSAYTFLNFGNKNGGIDEYSGGRGPAHVIQVSIDQNQTFISFFSKKGPN